MTAAIYARFSSDLQSRASIADQYRLCEARATSEGLGVTLHHSDESVSGATPVAQRPGGRSLLADALAGRIAVLLVESLDRISRDQVDLERTVRQLERLGIRIVGVSDGYDSKAGGRKVLRTMRGLLGELYLDDLRDKTHRGLSGRIAAGYSAGGRSYGYRSEHDGQGFRLVVDDEQAERVRWIFGEYVDGRSVQRIAHELNAARVPAPRSGTWAASCIYGSSKQGTGLLNNELYIGRVIWNRRQWLKDPDTGKRQKIDRPRSEWQIREEPELRIVSDDLWQASRERMATPRRVGGGSGKGAPSRTLFGGLLRCGVCGGAVTATSARHYSCVARKDRGPTVCAGVVAPREATDRRLLAMVREDMLSPTAIDGLQAAIREFSSTRMAAEKQAARTRRTRMDELDREIANLVQTIASGVNSPALIQALQRAEGERTMLESSATEIAAPAPGFDAAEAVRIYREKLMHLERVLEKDRERARRLLADLVGRVSIVQEGERVFADVEMEAPARLLVAGASLGVVAGARFHTRRLTIA